VRRWMMLVVVAVSLGAAVLIVVLLSRESGPGRERSGGETTLPSVSPPPPDAITVAAAGDICPPDPEDCARTADLVERLSVDAVLTLGDNQYNDGTLEEYLASYDITWGRFESITYPVAGNHEWHTDGAQGYLEYFGRSSTWYAFELGAWRLYALDGSCDDNGGCAPGDPQYEWLEKELAGRSDRCILGYWHQPRFSSGTAHGSDDQVAPLWSLLEDAGGDLVLNGHEHHYERFAPQDSEGRPASGGMVEIVAGTGGTPRAYPFGDPIANSEVRLSGLGVLEISLFDAGWTARFVRPNGDVDDQTSGSC
jgi:hypothetical protein